MNCPLRYACTGRAAPSGPAVVRFVFIDEGGISSREPHLVVVGVFVHGDRQLVPLENELARLVRKHIPEENHEGFAFHATKIWSGTGKIFGDREKWPLYKRLDILRDLVRVPKKLDLPIIYYSLERSTAIMAKSPLSPHDSNVALHTLAFSGCTLQIETYMREVFASEVAQVVAEDNASARASIKGVHHMLRYPETAKTPLPLNDILPLRNIRGSVHFANKDESGPLQIADTCAFFIRGHLSGAARSRPFFNRLKSMMFVLPSGEAYLTPPISVSPPYVVIPDDIVARGRLPS